MRYGFDFGLNKKVLVLIKSILFKKGLFQKGLFE